MWRQMAFVVGLCEFIKKERFQDELRRVLTLYRNTNYEIDIEILLKAVDLALITV